jgi:GTP pyrophosphokinase
MVKAKQKFIYLPDGTLDTTAWLDTIRQSHQLSDTAFLAKTCDLTKKLTQGLTTFYGQPCIEQGLEVAETILDLKLDQETAAAGIISSAVSLTKQSEEIIRKELGNHVVKLVIGVKQMDIIPILRKQRARTPSQLDKIRKMLLAMATDIRVVIIKLAERVSFLHGIKAIPPGERARFAQEILDIYAPLANRLGIGQLKWKLEDLAFRYQDPATYKTIATFLAERRLDRENRIQQLITYLQEKLQSANINADVTGRAKHIYSIYLKTQRKQLHYEDIYDQTALRILVPSIEDCYTTLSIVNNLWPPIMEEFDDYIANPKPNGYRSIHTAVVGEEGNHFEIQIRTRIMHEEAERGVAAHWLYKEKETSPLDDRTKISYLRQLLDWHQEVAQNNGTADPLQPSVHDDQIYVVTPAGDILDLPHGATPLDFAYHIHTELGHRCRGAKVNGQIVPLTYTLRTGDKVEIVTPLQGVPSRDWLNAELGYIKTSRARNKIGHWFKQQAFNQDVAEGRQLLERELARSGLAKTTSLSVIARYFNVKSEDDLLASVGRGNIRIGQIIHAIQPKPIEKAPAHPTIITSKPSHKNDGSAIFGGSDLLTRLAKCCKPIPGDVIIGYITRGRGISIHKKNCNNVGHLYDPGRFIQINWDDKKTGVFTTDLKIVAQEQEKVLHDLTSLLANEKIRLLGLNSTFNKNQNRIYITVTVQIQDVSQLQGLLHRLQQLPGIIEVTREGK